jgi:hypothetical protein
MMTKNFASENNLALLRPMGEIELSHNNFCNFSFGPFKVVEVKETQGSILRF